MIMTNQDILLIMDIGCASYQNDTRTRPHTTQAPERHLTYTVGGCMEQCRLAREDERRTATLKTLDALVERIGSHPLERYSKREREVVMQEIESLRRTAQEQQR